jgi:hypothetical protein
MAMKWFDQWFVRKSRWAWQNKHFNDPDGVYSGEAIASSNRVRDIEEDPHELNDGLRINLKKVIGGSLVTFKQYNRKLDRNENKTYIITSEQDFNVELAKIITMESLRQ